MARDQILSNPHFRLLKKAPYLTLRTSFTHLHPFPPLQSIPFPSHPQYELANPLDLAAVLAHNYIFAVFSKN